MESQQNSFAHAANTPAPLPLQEYPAAVHHRASASPHPAVCRAPRSPARSNWYPHSNPASSPGPASPDQAPAAVERPVSAASAHRGSAAAVPHSAEPPPVPVAQAPPLGPPPLLHAQEAPSPGGPPPASKAEPQPVDIGDVQTLKVNVNLVNVYFSVRDKSGYITNLHKDDCSIFEDKALQKTKNFTQEKNLPRTIDILLDTSGSQQHVLPL